MNILYKSDSIFSLIEEVVVICDTLEFTIERDFYDTYNENTLKPLIKCAEKCNNCKVNKQEVYNEYWGISRNVDDLPIVASLIRTRLSCTTPPMSRIWANDFIENVFIRFDLLLKWGYVDVKQYDELYKAFIDIHDFAGYWDCILNNIIDEMLCIQNTKAQQMQDDGSIKELSLPDELNTEDAREYFAKAIKVGYMERTNNGYKWLFGNNRGQARLGYFCYKVYSNPRPISKLEELFGVKKLSASISNADIEAKRADVKKWRNEIDNNIFND